MKNKQFPRKLILDEKGKPVGLQNEENMHFDNADFVRKMEALHFEEK